MSRKVCVPNIKGHLKAVKCGLKYLLTSRRLTIMYPEVTEELPPGYRGMIKLNSEKCVQCSLCARICPANAIKMYKWANRRNPGINYARCVFCGFCVDICPVGALEFTDIHDLSFYNLNELVFDPSEMIKKHSPFRKPKRRVKVKFDEKRGLEYE